MLIRHRLRALVRRTSSTSTNKRANKRQIQFLAPCLSCLIDSCKEHNEIHTVYITFDLIFHGLKSLYFVHNELKAANSSNSGADNILFGFPRSNIPTSFLALHDLYRQNKYTIIPSIETYKINQPSKKKATFNLTSLKLNSS